MEWTCPTGVVPTHYYTNWMQLELDANKNVKWPKKCPADADWIVPSDPAPADMGTFKGYTNKFTFANVDNYQFDDNGTTGSFNNESADNNGWDGVANAGAIIGFSAFGLAIIIVTAMIAMDMKARMAMYDGLIADDLQKMDQMGLGPKMKEFEIELAARLAGGAIETGVDD